MDRWIQDGQMDTRWISIFEMDGRWIRWIEDGYPSQRWMEMDIHLKDGYPSQRWMEDGIHLWGILQQPLQHRTVQRLHEQLVECLNVVVAIFVNNYEHYYFHCS